MVGGFLEGRRCCRWRAMEVASFVPGHVQNRGATPRSWTALCSKKNKVATPFHSNRIGLHGQRGAPGRAVFHAHMGRVYSWDAFTRHVRQMSGHDVSVAAEKRALWMSAFMAAPTKRGSPSRPAWRASVGRAAPHSSQPFLVAAGKDKARPPWEKCHAGMSAAEKRARLESALMATRAGYNLKLPVLIRIATIIKRKSKNWRNGPFGTYLSRESPRYSMEVIMHNWVLGLGSFRQ
jgi:hypothetical protein